MLRTSAPPAPVEASRGLAAGLAAVVVGLFAALALMSWADALGLLLLAVGSAVVLVAARKLPVRAIRWVVLGLAIRIAAALVQRFVGDLPDATGDAEFFEFFGFLVSLGGLESLIEGLTAGFPAQSSPSYSWFIGLVYWVFGVRSPLAIQAINVMLGSLAIVNAYHIAAMLWGRRAGVRVTAVAALFPALILYSAITLREAAVVYLLSLVALRVIQWTKGGEWRRLYAAAAYGVVAGILHVGAMAAVFAVVAIAAYAVVGQLGAAHRRRATAVLLVAGVGLGLYTLFQLNVGISKLGDAPFDAAQLGVKQEQRTLKGGAAYLTGLQLRSWLDVLWQGPIRVVYLLFTPFPWQVRSSIHAVGLVDVVGYWWLAYTAWRNRKAILANRSARVLVFLLGAVLLAYGLGTSNFGTAIRHRQKAVLLLMALAGAAWRRPRARLRSASAALANGKERRSPVLARR